MTGIDSVVPLSALEVVESRFMAGAKVAVQQGNRIHVSPAMYTLIAGAKTEAELLFVLSNIRVQKLPSPPRLPAYFPILRVFT